MYIFCVALVASARMHIFGRFIIILKPFVAKKIAEALVLVDQTLMFDRQLPATTLRYDQLKFEACPIKKYNFSF